MMRRVSAVAARLILPRLPLLLFLLFSTWTPWAVSRPSSTELQHSVYGRSTEEFDKDVMPIRNCSKIKKDFPQIFGQDELGKGAILVHFFAVIYISGCIGYICHAYFVPSLEIICEEWKIPHDVAGATIMASGTSLPELFAAIMGTFVTEDDTGTGAIVGSAAFNIYAILALCAFLAPKEGVKISWFPVLRDAFYWSVCMLVLIAIVIDGKLFWWESLILSLLYVVYVFLMAFNTPISETIKGWLDKSRFEFLHCKSSSNIGHEDHIELTETHASQDINEEYNDVNSSITQNEESLMSEKDKNEMNERSSEKRAIRISHNSMYGTSYDQAEYIEEALKKKEEEGCKSKMESGIQFLCSPVFDPPEGRFFRVMWLAGLPFIIICCVTIPDCRKPGFSRQLYIVTFIMSAVWCSLTCYVLFWVVTVIGNFFDIPEIIMGYTLLAVGTSLPDAISSAIVSKHGHVDLAIGNIGGSNSFELLVCLGMTWFVRSITNHLQPIYLKTHGFRYVATVLLVSYLVSLFCLGLHRWRINKRVGTVAIIIYIFILTAGCVTQMIVEMESDHCTGNDP